MDYSVEFVEGAGAPVTDVEYEEGRHGFDSGRETEEAAGIIAWTLEYMLVNFGFEPAD